LLEDEKARGKQQEDNGEVLAGLDLEVNEVQCWHYST